MCGSVSYNVCLLRHRIETGPSCHEVKLSESSDKFWHDGLKTALRRNAAVRASELFVGLQMQALIPLDLDEKKSKSEDIVCESDSETGSERSDTESEVDLGTASVFKVKIPPLTFTLKDVPTNLTARKMNRWFRAVLGMSSSELQNALTDVF